MNYIFCPSYSSIFHALYIWNSGEPTKIVTCNENIREFCESIGIDYVSFHLPRLYLGLHLPLFEKPYPSFRGIYRLLRGSYLLLKSTCRLIRLKRLLDNLFEENPITKDDSLIFFTCIMSYQGFYLAKEFSKKGNVYFKYIEEEPRVYKKKGAHYFNYWDIRILQYFLKIILGLNLILYDIGWKVAWGIDEHFLKQYRIEKLAMNKGLLDVQFDVINNMEIIRQEYDHIIISQYPGILNWVKYDSLKNMYKGLANLTIEFILKMHPCVRISKCSEGAFEEYFGKWEKLPDYLPAELVLKNIKKTVLSIASDVLSTAARFKHLKTISLLELVEWKDDSWKTRYKNHLIKESNNRVLFPDNFDELKELLALKVDPFV